MYIEDSRQARTQHLNHSLATLLAQVSEICGFLTATDNFDHDAVSSLVFNLDLKFNNVKASLEHDDKSHLARYRQADKAKAAAQTSGPTGDTSGVNLREAIAAAIRTLDEVAAK